MPTITASDFRNGVTFEMDGHGFPYYNLSPLLIAAA